VIVFNEEHLKRLLKDFIEEYYHLARPHQGLNGDTPVPSAKPEPSADVSRLVSTPVVGGLHHRYLISYSIKRARNKMKTTHRDHHWNRQ
jgi:putative transposase